MAKFKAEVPNEIISAVEQLSGNVETMLKEMTKAGADVAYSNVITGLPASWYSSGIMSCIKVTKSYKTPSDDGIATKVGIYGYFTNSEGHSVAAPLVANVTEYGRSSSPYPKRPFFRKAFKKGEIESAMKAVQDKYLPKV